MIKLEGLSKFYKTEKGVSVGIQKIDLEFKSGEFVALTGESGSGKSTLLNVMSGLDTYEEGEMYINGEETSHYTVTEWENFRNANIGFVFQNYNIIDSYTVLQNVMVALEIQGYESSKIKERALQLIEQVGLLSHKNHKASKLSGGQKQRCVIARALAKDAPIIMADEPTGNLDSKTGKEILQLLHEVSKDKLVIMVTHNFDEIKEYATRRVQLFDGRVISDEEFRVVEDTEIAPPVKPTKMTHKQMQKFALRNLFSTPKKLFFSVFVQTIIMFLILTVFANQVQSINSVSGMSGTHHNFNNQTEHRMILQKYNNQEFTDEEIEKIKSLNSVIDVIKNNSAFMDESSFLLSRSGERVVENYAYKNSYRYKPFASAIINPLLIEDGGRLPQNENEIIISVGDYNEHEGFKNPIIDLGTGDSFTLEFSLNLTLEFSLNHGKDYIIEREFTVVGVLKNTLYSFENSIGFHKNFFENNKLIAFLNDMGANEYTTPTVKQYSELSGEYSELISYAIVPTNKLSGNQISFNAPVDNNQPLQLTYQNFHSTIALNNLEYVDLHSIFDEYNESKPDYITIESDLGIKTTVRDLTYSTFVSDEIFENIVNQSIKPVQISVLVEDIVKGKSAVEEINNLAKGSYLIYYNHAIEDAFSGVQKIINQLATIVLMAAVVSLGYAIISWTQRNVLATRKRDFAIFRTMGANEKTLRALMLIEQSMITVFCFAITLTATGILSAFVFSFYEIYRHLTLGSYVFIFTLLMLFSISMANKFNKKMFKETVMKAFNS